jgi:hypothetical protein
VNCERKKSFEVFPEKRASYMRTIVRVLVTLLASVRRNALHRVGHGVGNAGWMP